MTSLSLPAPAKINLFLHITGRRADGYHDLQTVFHFLEAHDQLHFNLRDDDQIILATEFPGLAADDNLIVKAAKALQQYSACNKGVTITVDKHLPMGGGIGGGSSNAATTLLALNEIWQLNANKETLKSIGLQLGADVPIFIHGKTAWAEGVGENLTNLQVIEKWYVLLIPNCHVSTAEIFSHSQLTRDSKILKIATFLEQGNEAMFRNDCETLVKRLYPEVDEAIAVLSEFGSARMTGTGACVFAAFATKEEADAVCQQIPAHIQSLVTKGKNHSPTLEALASSL